MAAQETPGCVVFMIVATLMGASAYANLLGPELGAKAIAAFIDLVENRMFQPLK